MQTVHTHYDTMLLMLQQYTKYSYQNITGANLKRHTPHIYKYRYTHMQL